MDHHHAGDTHCAISKQTLPQSNEIKTEISHVEQWKTHAVRFKYQDIRPANEEKN